MAGSRAFVAIYPPPQVVAEVGALERSEGAGVRWVPESQWHVTLRFLGDNADIAAVDAALRTGIDHPPVEARLGPTVGHFGGRVLQVPVAGVDSLAAAVDVVLGSVSPPRQNPFAGHLTLGRARRRTAELPLFGTPIDAAWTVGHIHLVRSEITPTGARHERVDDYSLSVSSPANFSDTEFMQ